MANEKKYVDLWRVQGSVGSDSGVILYYLSKAVAQRKVSETPGCKLIPRPARATQERGKYFVLLSGAWREVSVRQFP